MRWIENMRQRPDREKKIIAFSIAGVLTALMFVVWATTIPARFSGADEELASKTGSPFTDIKVNMASSFEAIGKNWEELVLMVQALFNK